MIATGEYPEGRSFSRAWGHISSSYKIFHQDEIYKKVVGNYKLEIDICRLSVISCYQEVLIIKHYLC